MGEWQEPTGQIVNTKLMHDTMRRLLEIDIMELEGTAPGIIELERYRANAALHCSGNPAKIEDDMKGYHMRKQAEVLERLKRAEPEPVDEEEPFDPLESYRDRTTGFIEP
jgi:hypothetical protein